MEINYGANQLPSNLTRNGKLGEWGLNAGDDIANWVIDHFSDSQWTIFTIIWVDGRQERFGNWSPPLESCFVNLTTKSFDWHAVGKVVAWFWCHCCSSDKPYGLVRPDFTLVLDCQHHFRNPTCRYINNSTVLVNEAPAMHVPIIGPVWKSDRQQIITYLYAECYIMKYIHDGWKACTHTHTSTSTQTLLCL